MITLTRVMSGWSYFDIRIVGWPPREFRGFGSGIRFFFPLSEYSKNFMIPVPKKTKRKDTIKRV